MAARRGIAFHRACFEALVVIDSLAVGGEGAAATIAQRTPNDPPPPHLADELENLIQMLPQLDTALQEALGSRNRKLSLLGRPERAAMRYGAWLLLGPRKMDIPLASSIAADLVDRYGEANARPLVQGCLSFLASR
ncbi:hypothetical protein H8D30_00175 [bacterium]|nr:hypothetical protein [bacterium]